MVCGTAINGFTTKPTAVDPYSYQAGFGNRFTSEVIPGVIPRGRNLPQKVKYELYQEQLNGASVIASREAIQHVWLYRIRPSVAHGKVQPSPLNPHIETCFLPLNPEVEYVASQEAWDPFPLPPTLTSPTSDSGIDFIQGARTIGGQGDPTLREGLAIHVYQANASMRSRAFVNNDGDMLILPQEGRLDIQTELGWLMVSPGELVVIQAGIRFRVLLPDGPSRGYIQELFGGHYELPNLGPVGSNGLALPQDFLSPVASFDTDEAGWTIVCKVAGGLQQYEQQHSPFDVVAWQGNLVPYKYAIQNFINMANTNRDQADPTIYCVLTAQSKRKGVSLTDFLVFTEKWLSTEDTFRPPYYHRNMSTEVMGLLYGRYGGSSHVLEPGGLSYEASYMPHGETYEAWRSASQRKLENEKICEGTVAFMFHISVPLMLTAWAISGGGSLSLHESNPKQWDSLRAPFLDHLDEINSDLLAAGLPELSQRSG